MKPRAWMSWSSGKDAAWALGELRRAGEVEVVGLVTTFNEAFDRAAMHGVRRELVEGQAKAAGLPLIPVMLPFPCSNEAYEARMREVLARAVAEGVTRMAFGDLFLEDVRKYREDLLRGSGVEPMFPIWSSAGETLTLARRMLAAGVKAVTTTVDPKRLDPSFVGRAFDASFLADLPPDVDPCAERGEFHTFCRACPAFAEDVRVVVGEKVERDGFWFADLKPA